MLLCDAVLNPSRHTFPRRDIPRGRAQGRALTLPTARDHVAAQNHSADAGHMTYILYYAPDNASLIVRLVLEELYLPYETRLVDRSVKAQQSPAYKRLAPTGLIPALDTPDGVMFETAAILVWLAERHDAMAPPPTSPDRAAFLKWLFFVSNTLHADMRSSFYPEVYVGPDASAQQALRRTVQLRLKKHLRLLDGVARQANGWLGASEVSVLDYYLAAALRWCALYPKGETGWFSIKDYPGLWDMAESIEGRAAVRACMEAEGLGPTPFTAPKPPKPPEGSAL